MNSPATIVSNWKVDQLDDLAGRRYLITGANSGVGFQAAAHLRRANADVFVAARSPEKGRRAIAELRKVAGVGTIELIELDLASIDSIRGANAAIREHTDGLDAIINNAGIMQTPQLETADGFELQFGTNHLGHFLLNHLMFDLVSGRSGRIVRVSSVAHRSPAGINLDDPMFSQNYTPMTAYAHSKLANLVYGFELARRLRAAGSNVKSVSVHPGYSATNLQSTGPTGLFKAFYKVSNMLLAQSATDGAIPEVLAAAGNEAQNGAYYGPTRFGDARGPVGESTVSNAARSQRDGTRLWELSERLLGIEWSIH